MIKRPFPAARPHQFYGSGMMRNNELKALCHAISADCLLIEAARAHAVQSIALAYFDVRVFNPLAPSNRQPLPTCYRKHENQKKRAYEQRVREIEHGSFTPLVMSLTGGLGNAASVCYKRLASLISAKRDVSYSSTMAWIRCSLSFSLLRSSIQCIRGARSTIGQAVRLPFPPLDLVSAEARFSSLG